MELEQSRCVWTGKGKTRRRDCDRCLGYAKCEKPEQTGSEGIFSILVEKSDFRKGAKCLLIPGYSYIARPNIPVELFEDLEVWVHEFSEIAVMEWLKNNGLPKFTHDEIECSIFGRRKYTSLAHLLISLHTISYICLKKRLRQKLVRLTPEDFANNILISGVKTK